MMIAVLFPFLLLGCTTKPLVQPTPPMPTPPEILMREPQPLKQLSEDSKLSDVAETLVFNYGLYHELSEQLKALQSWILEQKKLYDTKK